MPDLRDEPKRKRRWFRFSLKTFLVLVTLFCVLMAFLGSLVYRVNKQKEAIRWVQDHGGTVYYDFQSEDIEQGRIDGDAEPPGPDWLRELIGVDYFADVAFVDVEGAKVKDLEPLSDLTQLQVLILNDTQVSDLEPLRGLTQLQELYLTDAPVSDLRPLRKLTQLKFLELSGTLVSDLSSLAKIKGVTIYLYEERQVTVPEELKDRVLRVPSP